MRPPQPLIRETEPLATETSQVAFLLALIALVAPLGMYRMLYARVNWDNLFESASPPGAATPTVAKATYTTLALRQYHDRQRRYRSGLSGFRRAILAA